MYRVAADQLELTLFYNSYSDNTQFPDSVLGSHWSGRYFVRVKDLTQGLVGAKRPDGREFEFRAPPTGNVYLHDADIADRLEKLTDASGNLAGWRYTTSAGDEVEEYDADGKLLRVRNRVGLEQTMAYSTAGTPPAVAPAPGLLIAVTDSFGRQLNVTYDAQKRITRMTGPSGGQYLFEYDGPSGPAGANNLTKLTFPDLTTRVYHYNEQAQINGGAACLSPAQGLLNNLTGLTDENGTRYSTWTYDCQVRVTSSQHALGADLYTFTYGSGSTVVVDPLGTSRTVGVERVLGVAKGNGTTQPAASGPGTSSDSITHDANGNVSSRTDWNGNRTSYSYDIARNLETSRTEGLTSAGAVTPATRTIETQWHATFRLPTLITEKDSGGAVLRTTSMTHDANGNVLTRTVASGANSRTWTYTYNANGSVLTMDGPRADVADVTTYTYYANDATCPGAAPLGCRGQVETITNALGHVTSITAYNAHGHPLTIVDPNVLTTTLAYDTRQRLTSRDIGGESTTYEYDGVGQLTKVILPDGSFLSYGYDAAHRLMQISDNLGNRIAYTLDAMGNRTQERVFDPLNALAQTRSRVYSNLNRLAQEIGAQSQTTTYAYDNQGNVTSIDGPLAGAVDVTTNAYDALNRLVRVTDPNAGQANYGYNALDQLTSVADPRSLATNYTINGLGNLTQQVSPDTGTTVNTYDAAGNLLTSTDAKSQVTTYTYDALNRVANIAYQGGVTHTFQYDQGANGKGRLTQITEPNSTTQYAYDPKGRLVTETRTINAVMYFTSYSYDSFGRMTGMTYPSGRQVTYTLDSLGRIQQIVTTKDTTQTVVSSVAYRPFGPAQGFTFGNSQIYTRGFDQDGRIVSYTLAVQSFAVGYDAASRISFLSDVGNPSNSNTYSYDNLDRLTNAVLPGTPFAYSYDAVGNRLTKTVGSSTDNYAYGGTSNRLSSITPGTGLVRSYTHDAVGSITADGVNTYAYDTRGRLVQANTVLGLVQYQVNALGQRVAKTVPGTGVGTQILFSDTFPGPEGRPIDDQADGLWRGGGKKTVATVNAGQAEIAPRRRIQTVADFALPAAGLTLRARLARGKVVLLNVAQDEGLIVRYAGSTIAVARAGDDDGDDLTDDANVRARFELSAPGAVLLLLMELRPGAARVRITAGAQAFDTGEIALAGVQAGERYRVRLAAVRLKGQALSGLVDDVLLTTTAVSAPALATTHFGYDTQGRLIGEYTGQGTLVREYAYLGDVPVALFGPDGAAFFVHTDHLSTPRAIYNQQQQLVWLWDQADPFGGNPPDENPSGLGTFSCNLRLPGQYFDKETNLHYNYFRDYDPAIGRYIQSDPIGLRGGINTYAYVRGNPLVRTDPVGLWFDGSGCGDKFSDWIIPDIWLLPTGIVNLRKACANHDACYDDCVMRLPREQCDQRFVSDVISDCQILGRPGCATVAIGYYTMIRSFGGPAFSKARQKCVNCDQ